MSEFSKIMIGLAIVIASGFLGWLASAPVFDAAARAICTRYAAREGLVLLDARGGPHSVPAFSCRFRDPDGATVLVDEDEHLIEIDYRRRGWSMAGFAVWALVVVVAVRLSQLLGLLGRPD